MKKNEKNEENDRKIKLKKMKKNEENDRKIKLKKMKKMTKMKKTNEK